MGRITSGVGLVSGINSRDIIDQLISLEQQPKVLLQTRQAKVTAQKDAYQAILTQLTSLQTAGRTFERPSTFTAATAQSSDEDVLTATTSAGAAVGSFQFQVARLVTAQQSVSGGFADPSTTVGAGTLTVEMGGGNLNDPTNLSQLNGGAGVRRGQFRITDRSGKSSVVDVGAAVSLDDVIRKINTSLEISVRASVQGDKLVLTDSTGQTVNDLIVQDLADGHAAEDLGIAGSAAAATLTGTDVNSVGADLSLSTLNDGRGVRVNSTGHDFVVTARDGSTTNVTLGANLKTVGDVLKAINTAGGGKFKASVSATGNGITLTDTTGGGGTLSVVAASPTSKAAADLGLVGSDTGNTLAGKPLLAGLNTVLVSSLKGGAGLPLGEIQIHDRGGTDTQVDLTGAKTVQDILDTINTAGANRFTASLKASGNGIQIVDTSGGGGSLAITDLNAGTTAAALGIAGTYDATKPVTFGANLQFQWVSETSLLSTYNGGKGVTPGAFTITNSAGNRVDINLAVGTFNTLGDVINEINNRNAGVTASINANGDGLLLTDTAAGAGKLKVENKTGTTATDLNILGTATATTIDGSFEKTIDVTATDTLTTVQTKLQTLSFGVSASVINDGSGQSPYRLSLTSFNGGRAGRVVFDAGATSLQTRNLVESQDAAVFLGGTGASEPLLITSSKNQLANVIPGVTVDLHAVSEGPVSLNVTRDPDIVVDTVKKFAEDFNAVVDRIKELTKYDTDKKLGGLLLGDGTIQSVQAQLYVAIQGVVPGAGRYRILADVGVKLGEGAKIEFDEAKFRSAYAADPEAVKNLFSQVTGTTLAGTTPLARLNGGRGVTVGTGGADFRVTTKDATTFDITVNPGGTVADVINSINTASAGKVLAEITADGKGLKLTDKSTTGAGVLTVGVLNGSLASNDLGIAGTAVGGAITGRAVFTPSATAGGGGFGYLIERSMKSLIDPVDGVVSRQRRTLEDRIGQFQDRMDNIDKQIESKRARLERQFANMESVLAGLQSQQTALGSLSSLASVPAR